MKATLIFPPATDPRGPHLALPCLAASLRRAGVETELLDLDIDGMLAVLQPDRLKEAGERLRARAVPPQDRRREALRRMTELSEVLPERMDDALAVFRDRERFYDPNAFNSARETVCNGLDLVSAACRSGVRYNIAPIAYDVEGVDVQSLSDLIRATSDDVGGLFDDYWDTDVFPMLDAQGPDLIGITITNRQQIVPGLRMARKLRRRGHFVVLGGTVYTKFTEQLRRLPEFFDHFADGVVAYEGDTALVELVHQLNGPRDFTKVPNYLYARDGAVHMTRTHVEDVAALPTPDFEGLPLGQYLTPEPVLPILYGKGCYFNRCKFCDIPYINSISRKAYRVRPPELVAEDLARLHDRFGARHFVFTDEALAPRLLERLADALEPHRERELRFVGYARLEPGFTPELCRKLAGMGMTKLFFGLESGTQETIDHMDKRIKVDRVPAVLQNCRDAGILFHLFSIVGFPEETEESARGTYRFFAQNVSVIDHPGNSFDIHPFGLELRTRYAEEADALGMLVPPEALTKDFVIGVEEWTNSRGLSRERVEALLSEFHLLLRNTYRNYHASAQQLWPAFEEFAVLYADRYQGSEFRHRTSLPPPTDRRGYRLRWNPSSLVEHGNGDTVIISSRHSHAVLERSAFELLDGVDWQSGVDILAASSGGGHQTPVTAFLTRQRIAELIAKALLQLVPLQAGQDSQGDPS
jgi:radical SAM superfamily enzyme YgiQ (UPF0313 family)